ncbi:effector-associated domain 2-containing protein [Streptomyces paradoxus]|uniref:effector-associated domain 2-containing protein n=1 Tax=Streptomyces paradoxus TaxID=66375 RepID=UPI003821BEC1
MTGAGPLPSVHPARVHALVVGIEAYEAGDPWRLPGPARDAVRFWRLLRDAGVPEANLRLHLSPLPPYAPDVPYGRADQATLRRVLVRELSPAQGDMLWVWWGGHGVLDRSGRLRLFCADAGVDDKVGIDLDSALARYAGDAVPGLREQLWIVDACETFEEDLAFREALPAEALPVGRPDHAHRQTVLRAAGRGRAAANDPVRATGLFSDVLLGLLAGRAAALPAPPDPEELFPAVRARIAALREEGRTLQHPEIRLQGPDRTETLPPAGPPAVPRPLAALQRVVEALLAYPLMHDPDERQSVIAVLNPRVTAVLRRHSRARTDVVNLVGGLARRDPGALWDLFDAVVSLDDDPELREELDAATRELAATSERRRDRR